MIRRLVNALWGYALLTLGVLLLAWVLSNLFVHLQPEAEGRTPAPAALIGTIMVLIGASRVMGVPWQQGHIWRSRVFVGALVFFLVGFGAAYCFNLVQRLQRAVPSVLTYASVALDLCFLAILVRTTWGIAGLFWRPPD